MKLFFTIARQNPRRSLILLVCIVLGGLADGIGASSLVPFINQAAIESGVGVAGAISSTFEQSVRDSLSSVGLQPTIGVLLMVVVGMIVVKALLLLVANQQIGYCVARTATDLRLALLRALLGTRWGYYVHQPIGLFSNSMSVEAIRAAESYLSAATMLSFAVDGIIAFVVILLISWKAGLVTFAAAAGVALLLRRLVRSARKAGAAQTRQSRSLLARLTDMLQGIKPLKSMNREMLVAPLLESDTALLNRALEKAVVSKAGMRAIQDSLVLLLLALFLYGAVTLAGLPLTIVITLSLLSQRIISAAGKMQKEYQKLVIDESAFWAMRKMISDAEKQRENLLGELPPRFENAITFRSVHFAYDENDRWILRDASLEIPMGELTVLVGTSGAGKTTMVDLIVGLMQPQQGQVLIDNVPLADVDAAAWRSNIGYVPQETFLLHDTVRMNVGLGDPTITDRDVEEALEAAEVRKVVAALPEDLSAIVGERGLRLSGGQRQRIALARALIRRPRLLILDEATTALDPVTEREICSTLRGLRSKMAIVAICHQGALIEEADRVYRLADGQISLVRAGNEQEKATA